MIIVIKQKRGKYFLVQKVEFGPLGTLVPQLSGLLNLVNQLLVLPTLGKIVVYGNSKSGWNFEVCLVSCDPLYLLKTEIKKRPVRVGRQLPLARWFTYSVFQTRILVYTVKQVIGLVFSYSDIKWTPTGWASWLDILWQLFKPKLDIEIF